MTGERWGSMAYLAATLGGAGMTFFKSIVRAIAAVFAIFGRQQSPVKSSDFGTVDRAEERERDRRFLAGL
jgi:hypothetical protein